MRRGRAITVICMLGLSTAVLAFQFGGLRSFQAPPVSSDVGPADAKHEFAWSRLKYNAAGGSFSGFGFGYG